MTTILHIGSRGADVATLQRRLNAAGAHLRIDHIYGPTTASAVRVYQRSHGLVADGIAGPRTQTVLISGAIHGGLDQAAIEDAAASLQCDIAAIQAVVQVESGADGYLPDGRVDILYERHIMYRMLKAAGIDPAPYVAGQPDIVNPTPGGYLGGAAEYRRLARARHIDVDCALQSASWGRFQLMGFHWEVLGYASPGAFVETMQSGEAEQMHAFVRFLELDNDMLKALRDHDWLAFAHAYNGPASAKNHYAGRLERAYKRHVGTGARKAVATAAPAFAPPAKDTVRPEVSKGASKPALEVPEPPPPCDPNDIRPQRRRGAQKRKGKPATAKANT